MLAINALLFFPDFAAHGFVSCPVAGSLLAQDRFMGPAGKRISSEIH
jgi:hypothetical protein